jgi:hypothetical protein
MRQLLIACAALALTGAAQTAQITRTPEAQAKLDKWLAGRMPAEKQNCVPMHATFSPIGIDDYTVLFRDGPRIWRNDLRRGRDAGRLDRQSQFVTESRVGRVCAGDDFGVLQDGELVGTGTLGEFVLYKKP